MPIVFAFAVSVVILGYSVVVYRDRREDPLVVLYALLALAATVWTGFSAIELLRTDPETKLLFYRLLHVGAAALPPRLFLFVLAFTDRTRWLRPSASPRDTSVSHRRGSTTGHSTRSRAPTRGSRTC